VEESAAREIAEAWVQAAAGGDSQALAAALQEALPDPDSWAVRRASRGSAVILLLAGEALYKVTLEAGDDLQVAAERLPFGGANVRILVTERREDDGTRRRQWRFSFPEREEEIDTELPPGAEPDRLEQFARRLAGAAGWRV
jgi:hypothetical protein